jgi:hypothetical protein
MGQGQTDAVTMGLGGEERDGRAALTTILNHSVSQDLIGCRIVPASEL